MLETRSGIIKYNKTNISCGDSPKGYGKAYFALRNFKPGEIIVKGIGKIIDHQTAHFSAQLGLEHHFVPEKWTGKYMNHSCAPNCKVKSRTDGFPDWVASKPIKKGEEITFGYYMTEFEWSDVAVEKTIWCGCKEKKKNHKIPSFSMLTHQQKLSFRPKLSKYLQDLCHDL